MKTTVQNEEEEDQIIDSGEVCSTDVSESQSPEKKEVKFGQE